MSVLNWFQQLLPIPSEFSFITYLALASIVLACVVLFFGTFASIISAVFGKK